MKKLAQKNAITVVCRGARNIEKNGAILTARTRKAPQKRRSERWDFCANRESGLFPIFLTRFEYTPFVWLSKKCVFARFFAVYQVPGTRHCMQSYTDCREETSRENCGCDAQHHVPHTVVTVYECRKQQYRGAAP